jgi:HD-GYP domain-containing protein (c-di-GMP phosphodiesterase class II)
MKFVPIPVAMLEVGKPLPVNIVSDTGQLLLRKGQPIVSAAHRDKLHAFNASASPADAHAWQRAYERMVHELLRSGAALEEIANLSMPSEIRESDYLVGQQLQGGWLDLQEVLRGILYQGGLAINPLARLLGIQTKALALVSADADDSLLVMFQALIDESLGYCATHALLCAVVCELTATKIGMDVLLRRALTAAALTMNIGMAREQDSMARQGTPLTAWQREFIATHASTGADILRGLGVDNPDWLDIVRWHHQPESPDALPHNLNARRILHLADVFVARTASRKSRASLSPLSAVKTMVMGAEGEVVGLGSAMAQAVGFYPPGTYVKLLNGDVAVAAQRGARANMPWVISIADKDALPLSAYVCRDTADIKNGIASAANSDGVRVAVQLDKVRKARQRIAGSVAP